MLSHTTPEAVVQNLKDAGCDDGAISRFMACRNEGRTRDSLRVLAAHRAALMEQLHEDQAKVDCLDYLIYQIKKDGKK